MSFKFAGKETVCIYQLASEKGRLGELDTGGEVSTFLHQVWKIKSLVLVVALGDNFELKYFN